MDADSAPTYGPASKPGGLVEPQTRTAMTGTIGPSTTRSAAKHYELRDPFEEVTYRIPTFSGMVSKAESLGSSRFVEVAEDGSRIQVVKTAGTWVRAVQRSEPAAPARAPAPGAIDSAKPGQAPASSKASTRLVGDVAPPVSTVPEKGSRKSQRSLLVAQIEAALEERYVIKRSPLSLGPLSIGHTEYRFKGDGARVAFIESTVRLATETNNPSVARSMVDVAEARNWKGLRISGHEDFKRMVWLEASMRRIKTVGYEPQASDLELLQREKVARMSNRIEPAKETPESASQAAAPKTSARGNGGRKAVLTAIEALLIAKQVPDGMRVAVMAAATDQLMQRIQTGRSPKVKVYDITAPSRARTHTPPPEPQRARDREGLTHAR